MRKYNMWEILLVEGNEMNRNTLITMHTHVDGKAGA
jgi:hypothetical protein